MLRLENVDVKYGNRQALFGLTMKVEQGEFVTLLGANGAGKTAMPFPTMSGACNHCHTGSAGVMLKP